MELLNLLKAVLLGIIEGITEWLPISSSGHILLFNAAWNASVESTESLAFQNFFLYFIQLGAILAVIVLFFKKLCPFKIQPKSDFKDAERVPAPYTPSKLPL